MRADGGLDQRAGIATGNKMEEDMMRGRRVNPPKRMMERGEREELGEF